MFNQTNLNMADEIVSILEFPACVTQSVFFHLSTQLIGFNQTKSTWTSYYLKNFTTINFPLSRIFLHLVCYIKCSTTENISKWGNKGSNLIINNCSQIPILVSQSTQSSFEPIADFSRITKEVERSTKI